MKKQKWIVKFKTKDMDDEREYLSNGFYELEEDIQGSLSPDQFDSIYEIKLKEDN